MSEDYEMDYDADLDTDSEFEADITSCPSNINSPELQDTDTWQTYDNLWGRDLFHCGYRGYLENVTPSPERPQQECFFDDSGNLVDEEHEDAGCRGTANQYDGHGDIEDGILHTFVDDGGIWENLQESTGSSIGHHWNDLWESDESEDSEIEPNSGSVFDDW